MPTLTVRRQLALALAALVVASGVVLLGVSYVLMRDNLHRASEPTTLVVGPAEPERAADAPPPPPPPPSVDAIREELARETLSRLLLQYAAALVALALVASGVGWVMAGRILRPLRQITRGAARIDYERLDERLALARPQDELKELADTFDSMLDRLETAFQGQQLFAANAAHELRTPLTVMRAELELALADPELGADELRATAVRLQRTVNDCGQLVERLLELSHGALAQADREPVRLDDLARERLDDHGAAIEARGIAVEAELAAAETWGDPSLLAQLVDNLLDNAVKYNVHGGWLRLATRSEDGHVALEVANAGAQLGAGDVDEMLEPFRRAGQQRVGRGGHGLGLSIVRTIAHAHGGNVTLTAPPDGGLAVRVRVPGARES